VLCPNCLTKGARTSTGKIPRLEKGKYCRVCGFRLIVYQKNRRAAAIRAWVVRKQKYGKSGTRATVDSEQDEFLSFENPTDVAV
jgi:hypothetical protein